MGTSTAQRYARALLEVASERGELSAVESDLQAIEQILDQAPDVRQFCFRSRQALDVRLEFIELAFIPYVHEITQRMLRAATVNNRLAIIPHLHEAFLRLRRDASGIEDVVLETVAPAGDQLEARVTERMEARIGKKVDLVNRLNPSLLGGFRILWRDRLLDQSAAGGIRALRRQLTR